MSLIKWSPSREVLVGSLGIGGRNPIRIQTMTNTRPSEIEATIAQIIRCHASGAELVRMAVPSARDAENLERIQAGLLEKNVRVALAADVHFNPKLAELAALWVDKVRINPGNYSNRKGKASWSNQEYADGIKLVRDRLVPLVDLCKARGVAIRVGTNHGSLSERVVSRYGHTPAGMVEATLEFLRIFGELDFHNLVVSLKASNPRVMVMANRLLFNRMREEGMAYPFHLGVTEAGAGEDGRIKSATGIASLLADGIGDTIRVSLTEAPENELPFARKLADDFEALRHDGHWKDWNNAPSSPFGWEKKPTRSFLVFGGEKPAGVIGLSREAVLSPVPPDLLFEPDTGNANLLGHLVWERGIERTQLPVYAGPDAFPNGEAAQFFSPDLPTDYHRLAGALLFEASDQPPWAVRHHAWDLRKQGFDQPFILVCRPEPGMDLAALAGSLLLDGFFQGLWIRHPGFEPSPTAIQTALTILQSAGLRIWKADLISCPSCGRTEFDIMQVTHQVREVTGHLRGLKIAVMGCIVNGPGEMADADYGYIGSGSGKVNLYRHRKLMESGVPEHKAIQRLIDLIKASGDWVDRPLQNP